MKNEEKKELNLNLIGETPLAKREDPSFGELFETIWKELTNEENKIKKSKNFHCYLVFYTMLQHIFCRLV